MSHQFSFLQAFVGYDSARSQLLTTCRREHMLKFLPAALQLGRYRLIEIMLLADMSKFQTQVCQRFMFFQQMSLYCSVLAPPTLADKRCNLTMARSGILNNRCIQRLKKVLSIPKSDCEHGDIFNSYIVIWLCNKLLQKTGFLNKQKASSLKCGLMCNLQRNLKCLKYWSLEGSVLYHQSFKFLHAQN